MNLIKLVSRPNLPDSSKLQKDFQQLESLSKAIELHSISDRTAVKIAEELSLVNIFPDNHDNLQKTIKKAQAQILKILEKEEKIVSVHHYRKLWMVVGMSAFGLPIGVAFGMSIGNLGMLGIGLPIGMAIGIGVGSSLNNKAKLAGRQLAFEVKS